MKMMDGSSFRASEKMAVTSFCESPSHFDCTALQHTARVRQQHGCLSSSMSHCDVYDLAVSAGVMMTEHANLARMLMKMAPDSFASALASIVLPVPGGPYRSTPFAWCSRWLWKSSGRFSGRMMLSTCA